MSFTVDDLLAAVKREPATVPVPELGREVYVRALSGEQGLAMAAEFQELNAKVGAGVDMKALARERAVISIFWFLCDEAGEAVAKDQEEARRLVRGLSMRTLNRIIVAGQKLNAADDQTTAALEKN